MITMNLVERLLQQMALLEKMGQDGVRVNDHDLAKNIHDGKLTEYLNSVGGCLPPFPQWDKGVAKFCYNEYSRSCIASNIGSLVAATAELLAEEIEYQTISKTTIEVLCTERTKLGRYCRGLKLAYELNGYDDPWRSVMGCMIHETMEAGEKAGLSPQGVVDHITELYRLGRPDLDEAGQAA